MCVCVCVCVCARARACVCVYSDIISVSKVTKTYILAYQNQHLSGYGLSIHLSIYRSVFYFFILNKAITKWLLLV